MASSESEAEVVMGPRGRDLCHGLEWLFGDRDEMKQLPNKGWHGMSEESWPKVLRGEAVWLNVTGKNMSSHQFVPVDPKDNKTKINGFMCHFYECASKRFKDIVIREVPGILMVKTYHIENPYDENSVLVTYRQDQDEGKNAGGTDPAEGLLRHRLNTCSCITEPPGCPDAVIDCMALVDMISVEKDPVTREEHLRELKENLAPLFD
eukprot:s1205_g7.t1